MRIFIIFLLSCLSVFGQYYGPHLKNVVANTTNGVIWSPSNLFALNGLYGTNDINTNNFVLSTNGFATNTTFRPNGAGNISATFTTNVNMGGNLVVSNRSTLNGANITNALLISPTNSNPISTNAAFYPGTGTATNVATFYGNTVHAGRAAFGADASAASMEELLELIETVTNATANCYGFRATITYAPTNPTDALWYSAELGEAITGGTNNLAVVRGNYGYVRHDNDKTLTNAWSHWGVVRANNASTINSGAGFRSSPYVDEDGRMLTYYHFQATDVADTSTAGLGDQYGLYIPNLTLATNNYSIYAGTAPSYFMGSVNAKGDFNCYKDLTMTNNAPIRWMAAAGAYNNVMLVNGSDNLLITPPTGGDINMGPSSDLMIKNAGTIVGKWGAVFHGNGSGLTNLTSTRLLPRIRTSLSPPANSAPTSRWTAIGR